MSVSPNEPKVTPGAAPAAPAAPRTRKPYSKPVLEALGDIRDVTMGGSLGAGESGMGGKTKKPATTKKSTTKKTEQADTAAESATTETKEA